MPEGLARRWWLSPPARKKAGDAKDNVNEFFFKGLQTNIELLPMHYPGWVIRIYHNILASENLNDFRCNEDIPHALEIFFNLGA